MNITSISDFRQQFKTKEDCYNFSSVVGVVVQIDIKAENGFTGVVAIAVR